MRYVALYKYVIACLVFRSVVHSSRTNRNAPAPGTRTQPSLVQFSHQFHDTNWLHLLVSALQLGSAGFLPIQLASHEGRMQAPRPISVSLVVEAMNLVVNHESSSQLCGEIFAGPFQIHSTSAFDIRSLASDLCSYLCLWGIKPRVSREAVFLAIRSSNAIDLCSLLETLRTLGSASARISYHDEGCSRSRYGHEP